MNDESYFPDNKTRGFKLYDKDEFKDISESGLINNERIDSKDLLEPTHKPI